MQNIDDGDMKISIDRRSFLGVTGIAAAAALAGFLPASAVAERIPQTHVVGDASWVRSKSRPWALASRT
jgi:hypothetical protein